MLDLEFSQNLLFVTGKGGTGKSFLAGILAARYADEGMKVLLVDAEATGNVCEHFEHGPVGYEPTEISKNIFALECRTDEALSEYLKLNAKIPTWTKITPLARLIDLVSNAAPGVKEILVTGKICFEAKRIIEKESDFEIIIVDAPSSGHVVSLLDAPRALAELVSRGIIQSQTTWMQNILNDKDFTGVVVCATTEEIVLAETIDLLEDIQTSTEVEIVGVVINKDIANLSGDALSRESNDAESEHITKLRKYYESLIAQTNQASKQFSSFKLFSLPLISEPIPSLRTLKKYADRFLPVKAQTK